MSINERIKKFRKHLGMTQAEFGCKIGIVQGHLTGLESGKKNVTPKTFKVICAAYGISEEWLETGEGEMYAQDSEQQTNRVIHLYNELGPELQDFMLKQVKGLLELQRRQVPIVSKKSYAENYPKRIIKRKIKKKSQK